MSNVLSENQKMESLPQLDLSKIQTFSTPYSSRSRKSAFSFEEQTPLTFRRETKRDLHRSVEYEDPELLAHQKYDNLLEIREIKNQNSKLELILQKYQNRYDKETEARITYSKFHGTDPSQAGNQERVFKKTKELQEIQAEIDGLDKKLVFFHSYFSEDVENRLKTEVGFQNHILNALQNQIVSYMAMSERTYDFLEGDEVAEGLHSIHSLNDEYHSLSEELLQQKNLNEKIEAELKNFHPSPKNDSLKQQVENLQHYLKSLQYRKEQRKKEFNNARDNYEKQKKVMEQINKEKHQNQYSPHKPLTGSNYQKAPRKLIQKDESKTPSNETPEKEQKEEKQKISEINTSSFENDQIKMSNGEEKKNIEMNCDDDFEPDQSQPIEVGDSNIFEMTENKQAIDDEQKP